MAGHEVNSILSFGLGKKPIDPLNFEIKGGATIAEAPTTPNNINKKLANANPMIAAGLTNVTKSDVNS